MLALLPGWMLVDAYRTNCYWFYPIPLNWGCLLHMCDTYICLHGWPLRWPSYIFDMIGDQLQLTEEDSRLRLSAREVSSYTQRLSAVGPP